jgi:hypothetical protein
MGSQLTEQTVNAVTYFYIQLHLFDVLLLHMLLCLRD